MIRREVLITPGDIFNSVRVETTKKRLDNLGYFSKVETYPEDTGVSGRKDLTIQVEEKRTGSLNFGAGFSTVDNLVGFIEMTQGNFDLLNWPNFTGAGQKFRVRIQYGTSRKDFILSLTEPISSIGVFLLAARFLQRSGLLSDIYSQRHYGFSIETRKAIGNFTAVSLGYRARGDRNLRYLARRFDAASLESGARTQKPAHAVHSSSTRRDNPFLSRRGHASSFTPYIAGGFLGRTNQIYGFSLEARALFPPLERLDPAVQRADRVGGHMG